MSDPAAKTSVQGIVERITFYNPDNHFAIIKLRASGSGGLIAALGHMPEPAIGETLRIAGQWETHPKYGQQLRVDAFEAVLPTTAEAIQHYLAAGFMPGLGRRTASRLVDHFGDGTLTVIETDPMRLMEVDGIGKKTATRIAEAWQSLHSARSLTRFLHDNGIRTVYCAKLLALYGPDALEILTKTPFRVAHDLPGIGFYIADTIAQNAGAPADDPVRVQACVLHCLAQCAAEGDAYAEEDSLLDRCRALFHIDARIALAAVVALADGEELVCEDDPAGAGRRRIVLKELHAAETGIARKMAALMSVPIPASEVDGQEITEHVLRRLAIQLSRDQLAVVTDILGHRLAVITGGPGTGKTTLIRSVSTVFESLGRRVRLAAPTGRAARRLAEVCGRKAATIHKMLRYSLEEGRFLRDEKDPIEADALIVDEASMVDTRLMYHLLQAVPMSAFVIFVGDVFQLPSVGPGNVLSDLIASGKIPVHTLTKIFRQDQESAIVLNAHRIRQGRAPDLGRPDDPEDRREFYFIEQLSPERVVDTVKTLCTQSIPGHFSLDPMADIQVLTPMHKGPAGTINLNQILQQALNPGTGPAAIPFRIGDKVMHLRNNYQKEVFNGDIGIVADIGTRDQTLSVDYQDRLVDYAFGELAELTLAYAISVHKSQGSEYPAVVIPLTTQHYPLLQRNLLYTAVTRAKQLVVLVGHRRALETALERDSPRKRLSGLADRLSRLWPG
jgi:exodeoxyribonuclease V alpha subunit